MRLDPATHEYLDNVILSGYQQTNKIPLHECQRIGVSKNTMINHALKLGVKVCRKDMNKWAAKELAILEQHKDKTSLHIQTELVKAGFFRSVSGINNKRNTVHGNWRVLVEDENLLTASQLASALGRSCTTVTRWIYTKELPATMRGKEYVVRRQDVRKFLKKHPGKVSPHIAWVVDLFTE